MASRKRRTSASGGGVLPRTAKKKNRDFDYAFGDGNIGEANKESLDAVESPPPPRSPRIPRKENKRQPENSGGDPLLLALGQQRPDTSHGHNGRKWGSGAPARRRPLNQRSKSPLTYRATSTASKYVEAQQRVEKKTLVGNGVRLKHGQSKAAEPETIDICSGDEAPDRKPAAGSRQSRANRYPAWLCAEESKQDIGGRGEPKQDQASQRKEFKPADSDNDLMDTLAECSSEVVYNGSYRGSSDCSARTQDESLGRTKKTQQKKINFSNKKKQGGKRKPFAVTPGASLTSSSRRFTKVTNVSVKTTDTKSFFTGHQLRPTSSYRSASDVDHRASLPNLKKDEDDDCIDNEEKKPIRCSPRNDTGRREYLNDGHALRRRSKRKQRRVETVEIEDSDDEIENDSPMEVALATVAIGSRVSSSRGRLQIVNDGVDAKLTIRYNYRKKEHSHQINVNDEVHELKYRIREDEVIDDEETTDFISIRVTPTTENGLKAFSNSYIQNNNERPTNRSSNPNSKKKYYIVLDFREHEEFLQVIAILRSGCGSAFVNDDSKLSSCEVDHFAATLIEHQQRENDSRKQCIASPRKLRRKRKLTLSHSLDNNPTLLVYPFGGDQSELETCAENFVEAKDNVSKPGPALDGGDVDTEQAASKRRRNHFLTIRAEDRDRLEGEIYLNDTLVDFWMQWLLRHEGPDSDVHIFTSHFYTTLLKDGPKAVESWTAKKDINIFQKKLIFVPINKSLHWSLCCIVNPGDIMNLILHQEHSDEEPGDVPDEDDLASCMLFLDSLKAHQKSTVQRNLVKWLNAEWRRLGMEETAVNLLTFPIDESTIRSPFRQKTIKVLSPKVPYQDNGWDCGVFVCRYAYALLKMRDVKVVIADVCGGLSESQAALKRKITGAPAFQFGMRDIERFRTNLGSLVDGLSRLYCVWKRDEDRKEKEAKAERRAAKLAALGGPLKDTPNQEDVEATAQLRSQGTPASTKPAPNEDNAEAASDDAVADDHKTDASDDASETLSGFLAEAVRRQAAKVDEQLPRYARTSVDSGGSLTKPQHYLLNVAVSSLSKKTEVSEIGSEEEEEDSTQARKSRKTSPFNDGISHQEDADEEDAKVRCALVDNEGKSSIPEDCHLKSESSRPAHESDQEKKSAVTIDDSSDEEGETTSYGSRSTSIGSNYNISRPISKKQVHSSCDDQPSAAVMKAAELAEQEEMGSRCRPSCDDIPGIPPIPFPRSKLASESEMTSVLASIPMQHREMEWKSKSPIVAGKSTSSLMDTGTASDDVVGASGSNPVEVSDC